MNFSDRITFVKLTDSYYDPELGRYVESGRVRVTVPCKISGLGIERTSELFGSIDRNIRVARLQNPYEQIFDYVEIDGEPYQVERHSDYRKGVLFLEGLRHGESTVSD